MDAPEQPPDGSGGGAAQLPQLEVRPKRPDPLRSGALFGDATAAGVDQDGFRSPAPRCVLWRGWADAFGMKCHHGACPISTSCVPCCLVLPCRPPSASRALQARAPPSALGPLARTPGSALAGPAHPVRFGTGG